MNKQEMTVYLQILVLLLCVLYGSVFVFGKLTLEFAPPLFVTGARMIIASLLLLIYQFFFNRQHFVFHKKHIVPVLVIAIAGVYLTNAFEFWGLQYMEAGKACFLYSFCPIATAMMSYVWFSEKLNIQKCIGLIIGILGFIPLLIGHSSTDDDTGYLLFLTFAELAILAAAITSALGWIGMREVVKNRGYTTVMANATSMLIGGMIALFHSFITEVWDPVPISDFWGFLPWFLCLTLVSNLISYNLHGMLLKSFTATYLSFAGLSQPFFAAFLGWFFLDEILSPYFWISVIILSFGLTLYYQQELKAKQKVTPLIVP